LGVGGYTADDGDRRCADLRRGLLRASDERTDDRALIARREVGATPLELVRSEPAHRVQERGLDAGEREVEAGHTRDRKVERLRVAVTRKPVDLRSSWMAEAEQPRPLVERFAGGVVDRRPEHARLAAVALHVEEERVAAARKQTEEGRLERPGLQVERRDMAVQVIDRRERQSPRP